MNFLKSVRTRAMTRPEPAVEIRQEMRPPVEIEPEMRPLMALAWQSCYRKRLSQLADDELEELEQEIHLYDAQGLMTIALQKLLDDDMDDVDLRTQFAA